MKLGFAGVVALLLAVAAPVHAVTAVHLQCDRFENPLGIDDPQPALSWQMASDAPGEFQTSYQVLVASSPARLNVHLADLWNSGKVDSDRSLDIPYGGRALRSVEAVWWKVRIGDRAGRVSEWSRPARWEMGLLQSQEWRGNWIGLPETAADRDPGPPPFLRKEFTAPGPVVRARLYATALGLYDLYLNGQRVSRDRFRPGWTDYHRRIQYQTYDVTPFLRQGANAIGLILGDGWYCGRVGWQGRQHYGPIARALVNLKLDYADGNSETVATGGSWKVTAGPIRMSDLLLGETYDARREMSGWSEAGFDDRAWTLAAADPIGSVPLVAQAGPPVREIRELRPVKLIQRSTGAAIFDMGQNMVGWARLRVTGSRGQTVTLRFAEVLNPDGSIYTTNLRSARATDQYTLRGGGEELFEPRFTYHGFRYVEVTGYPERPGKNAITGIVAQSDTPMTGTFVCSDSLVNHIQHNIVWGQRGNLWDVPTDCPQRDERLGWMGDAEIFAPTACFNMNCDRFYAKWLDDVDDAQSKEGGFSDVSPRLVDESDGAPAWGDAGVLVPWTVYRAYGDPTVLERHYPAMQRWIEYIRAANPDLVWRSRANNNFGDWLAIGEDTPRDVLATAFFARDAQVMSQVALVLGRSQDARSYEDLAAAIAAAFQRAFVSDEGKVVGGTQTAFLLALQNNLLPPHLRDRAANLLVADIEAHGGRLATGFLGVRSLLPVLTETGHTDVAYHLLTSRAFPSWGYEIANGATTMWERWDGWTREHGFQDPGMNSFNHYAFGSVGEWIYATVGGLAAVAPGYKRFAVRPQPGGGIRWAKESLQTPYGPVQVTWRRSGSRFNLDLTVPPNTTADVYLPGTAAATVPGRAIVAPAGHYHFTSRMIAGSMQSNAVGYQRAETR